jgi:hypothetical protein
VTADVAMSGRDHSPSRREISLVDLLDRLLATGVVLTADVTISLSGVDLVHVKLNALITSVRAEREREATS